MQYFRKKLKQDGIQKDLLEERLHSVCTVLWNQKFIKLSMLKM